MPKDLSLPNMVKDLDYIVNGTYVHQWLHQVCPPRPGLRVLEVGAGSGKFSLSYALKGAEAYLFDIDPQAVEYCQRLNDALVALVGQLLPTSIFRADLFGPVGLPEEWADLVFNEGVPQHWPDEERRQGCIDRMARWSRDLVVIMGNNGLNPHEQDIDRSFSFKYQGMPPQRKCFTPDELKERMERAGLKDVQAFPLDGTWQKATLFGAYGRKR